MRDIPEDNWWYGKVFSYNITSGRALILQDERTDEIVDVRQCDDYANFRGAVWVALMERLREDGELDK